MNNRLNIQDLATLLAEQTGKDRAEIERFLRELVALVSSSVYEDRLVKVKGLGTFKIIPVEKRESIHVNTGERFVIPAHYKFSFLPDKELREQVNKPFSMFETTEVGMGVNFTGINESREEKELTEESGEEVITGEEQDVEVNAEASLEQTGELTPISGIDPTSEAESASEPETKIFPEPDSEISEPTSELDPEFVPKPEASELSQEDPDSEPEASIPESEETKQEAESSLKNEEPPVATLIIHKDSHRYHYHKKKNRKKLWIGILVLLIAIAIFLFFIWRDYTKLRRLVENPEKVQKKEMSVSMPQSDEKKDTMIIPTVTSVNKADTNEVKIDTTTAKTTSSVATVKERSQEEEMKNEQSQPKILDTVTIKHGDLLTVISLKYYGHKLFWVYIYQHNKSIIADPNNIPIGTKLEIPVPELYGIDANSQASRERAAALQQEILSK